MDKSQQRQNIHTKEIGNTAENVAARYLQRLGYKIVERNFYCKAGELDIIAIHKEELVFVEVRSRHSENSLNPLFTISNKKLKSIKRAAQIYLSKNWIERPFRFDFAFVTMNPEPTVEIIENALFELPVK